MTDKLPIHETFEIAQKALSMLQYNISPANPQNFELWYTYVSGQNPELVRAVQEKISRNNKLDPDDSAEIYEKFLSPKQSSDEYQQIGLELSQEILELSEVLNSVAASSGQYGRSVEAIANGLSSITQPEQLKHVLLSISETTIELARNSKRMEKRLEESQIQLRHLYASIEDLRNESSIDSLTKIANRRVFDRCIKLQMELSSQHRNPLCLLLVDIDRFKTFNDRYGHQIGDQVLKFVAHTLKSNVKEDDLVTRYGGEEFAILLPNTFIEEAIEIANRLRIFVQEKELIKKSSGTKLGRVTVSIGVSEYNKSDSIEDFINRTDRCLYSAKENGRNQVVSTQNIENPAICA